MAGGATRRTAPLLPLAAPGPTGSSPAGGALRLQGRGSRHCRRFLARRKWRLAGRARTVSPPAPALPRALHAAFLIDPTATGSRPCVTRPDPQPRPPEAFEQRGREVPLREDGMMITIDLPAASGRLPISSAAATAAPDEIPTGMPSTARGRGPVSNAVLVAHGDDLVDPRCGRARPAQSRRRCLDLVRARLAAGQHRRILRFHRDHLERRPPGLQHLSDTVMVPPVPTPETK